MTETLGDYHVLKSIGKGALGEVFFAEHRFLKKAYALKVLDHDLSSDERFISRFTEEVSALSCLDHPHIARLHNVSEAEGRYFLVTEGVFEEGEERCLNLAEYLAFKEAPLSEEEIIHILKQIASALDFAHEIHSFSHEGLKLNNILIRQKDAHVYLTDFGLTRVGGSGTMIARTYKALTHALESSPQGLSPAHRSFIQAFAFLAPEQKFGSGVVSGLKVDIYAFGVLAYYLLMHKLPEGIFEMPSHSAAGYKHPWDKLITACLQQDPEKRVSSLKASLAEVITPGKEGDLRPVLKQTEIVRPEFDADPSKQFQIDTSTRKYQPAPQEHKSTEPLRTEMVVIQGGTFYRGSNNGGRDEMPKHAVILSSFALDIHPVTNEQFVRFLEAMGGEKDFQHNDIIRLRDSRLKRAAGKLMIEAGYAGHPVVGVTWYGATAYAKWVGKRLPTEAEWEIAAYGGSEDHLYPTGKNMERTQANFFSSDTTVVMSYPANGYGLYDMAGNVYEWCQDWYDYHYYTASMQEPNNPQGPLQGVYRVLRGGCWKSLKDDLRCSHRHRNNPGTVNSTYGFRCAADVS